MSVMNMSDLERLLKIVCTHKKIAFEIMQNHKYPSGVYLQAKGSHGAYCTVETYINNLIFKNVREEN